MPASKERFLKPEYAGRKPGASMMTPIFGGISTSLPTRLPSTRISPDVGRMKPQMHFMSTVLPEPLRPISPWICPGAKLTLTSCSTVVS